MLDIRWSCGFRGRPVYVMVGVQNTFWPYSPRVIEPICRGARVNCVIIKTDMGLYDHKGGPRALANRILQRTRGSTAITCLGECFGSFCAYTLAILLNASAAVLARPIISVTDATIGERSDRMAPARWIRRRVGNGTTKRWQDLSCYRSTRMRVTVIYSMLRGADDLEWQRRHGTLLVPGQQAPRVDELTWREDPNWPTLIASLVRGAPIDLTAPASLELPPPRPSGCCCGTRHEETPEPEEEPT